MRCKNLRNLMKNLGSCALMSCQSLYQGETLTSSTKPIMYKSQDGSLAVANLVTSIMTSQCLGSIYMIWSYCHNPVRVDLDMKKLLKSF
jgi:hypothetical protein